MTVLPRWRDVALADVSHADLQQWVTWLTTAKEARQPGTTDKVRNDKRQPLSARRAVQAQGIVKRRAARQGWVVRCSALRPH